MMSKSADIEELDSNFCGIYGVFSVIFDIHPEKTQITKED